MMRVPNLTGGVGLLLLAALVAGCSTGGELTTGAGAPRATTGSAPPPGTVILADSNGEIAAESLGKIVATTPETTEAPTTTAAPTTAAPVFVPTTARPTVTPGPTTPQTTQALPTPTLAPQVTQPNSSSKPLQSPISIGALTADEQAILNTINSWRGSNGLGPLTPEKAAVDAARAHSASMESSQNATPIPDIINAVNARYTQLTSVGLFRLASESAQDNGVFITTNYASVVNLPFAYVGVGVRVSGGRRWITVIVGS